MTRTAVDGQAGRDGGQPGADGGNGGNGSSGARALPAGCVLHDDPAAVDWAALKAALGADDFDNGRSAAQLRASFERSAHCVFARAPDGEVIGKARALSDGVCNAYVVDVWTRSDWRRRGIARAMLAHLEARLDGQHVALIATDAGLEIYRRCGYRCQPEAMSKVIGTWLQAMDESGGLR